MVKYTKEELTSAISSSFSIAEVCRKLGIAPYGGNYRTIHKLIKEYSIDTSHFTGQGWNKGLKKPIKIAKPINEILIEYSTYSSTKLKNRLFKEKLKEEKCEMCGITEWNGKPISLELHHINGNPTDNRIENLQILCPNCHSQTDTYRKAKSALSEKIGVESLKVREGVHGNADINPEPSISQESDKACAETLHGKPKSKKPKEIHYCATCGKPIPKSRKYCSVECYRYSNKGNRPDVFTLLEIFEKYKTFTKVGEYFNVSDNAVRKWCIIYGILDMVKSKSRPQQ